MYLNYNTWEVTGEDYGAEKRQIGHLSRPDRSSRHPNWIRPRIGGLIGAAQGAISRDSVISPRADNQSDPSDTTAARSHTLRGQREGKVRGTGNDLVVGVRANHFEG